MPCQGFPSRGAVLVRVKEYEDTIVLPPVQGELEGICNIYFVFGSKLYVYEFNIYFTDQTFVPCCCLEACLVVAVNTKLVRVLCTPSVVFCVQWVLRIRSLAMSGASQYRERTFLALDF